METIKRDYLDNGYAKHDELINDDEVNELRQLYNELLGDTQRTEGLRSDLGGVGLGNEGTIEKITQIMLPHKIEPRLIKSRAYSVALNWARKLLGNDVSMDFDMLINKAPFTDTETPWHQDAAYWIDMPDKRTVTCWIALDDVNEENGCMWFIPRNENWDVLDHRTMIAGGALCCDADTSKARPIPLKAGGCTFHNGHTLHYSKGNSTSSQRRALILNFRPDAMIALERKMGFDHTGERKVRNKS